MLYRVGFRRDNVLKVSLVTTAAMLAICLLAFVETTNTAEAEGSLPHNGKIVFSSFGRRWRRPRHLHCRARRLQI